MKTHELFEDLGPIQELKKIAAEFRAFAADFKLTFQSGMGWPSYGKDGVWVAGGLTDRDTKGTLVLSADKRRIGFLVKAAKRLEELAAAGHPIKVASGMSKTQNALTPGPGEMLKALQASLKDDYVSGYSKDKSDKYPAVAFFIGYRTGEKQKPYLRMKTSFFNDKSHPDSKSIYLEMYCLLPEGEAGDKLLAWVKKLQTEKKNLSKPNQIPEWRYSARYHDVVKSLLRLAKDGGYLRPENFWPKDGKFSDVEIEEMRHYALQTSKVYRVPKRVAVVPTEAVLKVFKSYGLEI